MSFSFSGLSAYDPNYYLKYVFEFHVNEELAQQVMSKIIADNIKDHLLYQTELFPESLAVLRNLQEFKLN